MAGRSESDLILSSRDIADFQGRIFTFFDTHGRPMAWRDDTSPYSIFVSEIMLQQTQVSRVARYYPAFLKRFPDFQALADAGLDDLLAAWKGLGYNRRARFMREAARKICADFAGKLPADPDELVALPGIGKNTAGSIAAFAFNRPVVFIETNIRRVFLHEFFPGLENVHDREILPLIKATLPADRPRKWYWALMDYGVELKGRVENPNRRSRHYSVQTKFEGSSRQLRGEILRQLGGGRRCDVGELDSRLRDALPSHPYTLPALDDLLEQMAGEGFLVAEDGGDYRLAD